ncbi:VirB4-like conjugal transfer ATPase, CD1110 family [Anaerotruncus rubiinfantis]|uniref:VirB4-like conjugal transfer ATPase, CD1110 family n=1 Tax=Anaerotruncus rubiinfantis TaxID=1720200 RepID=UPI001FA9D8F0|nr:TraE family protein [Anaerotruncus rubiinfantis]
MMKTLKNSLRIEREKFTIPRSVQQSIPVKRIYRDNIWVSGNKFCKCYRFTDINYSVASPDDQMDIFLRYCAVLNSLDAEASFKITISNRTINPVEFRESILMPLRDGPLDGYRQEYNANLSSKAADGNNLVQERYITVSVARRSVEEARAFFARMENDLTAGMKNLSSELQTVNSHDRLRVLHDFFRAGEEQYFRFDLSETMRKGHSFKDYICPDSLCFKSDHFEIDGKLGRVIFLREYASYIRDDLIAKLTEIPRNLMLSIDILPIPTDEAVNDMQQRVLAVETDITRWQRKQNINNNFSAAIPYELEQMRKETREFLDDLTARDQRMMFVVVTLVHLADDLEALDNDTETLLSVGRQRGCSFSTLKWQQEDALNTVLPYGLRRIHALRTLTTESTAVLLPFNTQEIFDRGGFFYGVNAISHNPLICNRKRLLNGNAFFLGVPGSGKSMAAKQEITAVALNTEDDILVCDPENEYSPLVGELGGTVIRLAPDSIHHINALEMSRNYLDGERPEVLKSEFVLSLFEQLLGHENLGPYEKSILDRCVGKLYKAFRRKKEAPTLADLYEILLAQEEPEAHKIALASELFIKGSLDIFAKPTNLNTQNRILSFDISDLGTQLRPFGMLVLMESMMNRVMDNRKRGRRTWLYFDELSVLFSYEWSTSFLDVSWKRYRKYGALATGIFQNLDQALKSETAKSMISNSEFLLLMNQAAPDREQLARLLHISNEQLSYISSSQAGRGLIRMGGAIVPFINEFPAGTGLYRLMTTKPGETDALPEPEKPKRTRTRKLKPPVVE